MSDLLDLIIVGGGPAGLACAIEAQKKGMTFWVLEKGWRIGEIKGLSDSSGATLPASASEKGPREQAPTEADCPGCLGIGAPSIGVNPDLFIGTSLTTCVLGRRYHLNDIVSWQKGSHRIRFGGDWEITRGGRTDLNDEPVTMTLFSATCCPQINRTGG